MNASAPSGSMTNLGNETRTFAPPGHFVDTANAGSDLFEHAAADRLAFWGEQARKYVTWAKDFNTVLDWTDAPHAVWFGDGQLNVAYNCLDRHLIAGNGDRIAISFVGEPGDKRDITYRELHEHVCKCANTLLDLGVQAGDTVAIYLPMIPEAVIAMLACARIGAIHSVVFGGFSSEALAARIADAGAKVVITADGGFRKGKASLLKPAVDEALGHTDCVEKVIVVRRTHDPVQWDSSRDMWWHHTVDVASATHAARPFDAEHPLFILYTSGTTGKPKGILHTSGGYLVQAAYTHNIIHDIKPETDVYWCTADVGWVTGHTYVVYGPLANGVTQVMYEGTPDAPHKGRWWEIVAEYGVTVLYTAPTAIRTFMKWGNEIPAGYDLSSLRLLGSVGESINPEAWMWYREHIGQDRCPIVDTWWQTETGATMMSPLPGVTATRPGSAHGAIPGVNVDVVDDAGQSVPNGGSGYLVVTQPWPSMLRTIWGDDARYRDTYWSRFDRLYFAGDGAKRDEDGNIWLLGRLDDVMNVAGHRLSTTEIESSLVAHPDVAEAAVVGASDDTTGQAVCAFVIMREGAKLTCHDEIEVALKQHVAHDIGPIARPRNINVVAELPKTRSGKIMRRLLRDIADNHAVGDTTTLADEDVMRQIAEGVQQRSQTAG